MRRRTFLQLAAAAAPPAASPSSCGAQRRPLRVGVVGAGIVGASIAYHLAEAGAQVTVFEKTAPAAGATRNSFAWLNAFVADAHYRAVRLQSLLAYRDLDRRLGLSITWGGYLNWASDASQAQTVRANAAQLEGSAYPVISVSAADLAALSPQLAPGPISAALYSAIDGHLDPVHVTQRFLAAARGRYGAKLHCPCELRAVDIRSTAGSRRHDQPGPLCARPAGRGRRRRHAAAAGAVRVCAAAPACPRNPGPQRAHPSADADHPRRAGGPELQADGQRQPRRDGCARAPGPAGARGIRAGPDGFSGRGAARHARQPDPRQDRRVPAGGTRRAPGMVVARLSSDAHR